MSVTKYKNLFIGISGLLLLASFASMAVFGFKEGIDFAGGTLWQIRFESASANSENLIKIFSEEKIENPVVRRGLTDKDFSIRMKEITEPQHQELAVLLKGEFGNFEELSFSSIGPAVGRELRNKALTAFVLVLLGISLYVAFAFRKVSYPVSSWKYGLVTLVTLFHDALIPAGLFAFWGFKYGAELDINFIVAILVIIGFSVHDTIVVFDRIRENLLLDKKKTGLNLIIDSSIRQTFARSINTSLTLFLVLIALYLFGAESLANFNLLILIGTAMGTYSSIFVASPLLTYFNKEN